MNGEEIILKKTIFRKIPAILFISLFILSLCLSSCKKQNEKDSEHELEIIPVERTEQDVPHNKPLDSYSLEELDEQRNAFDAYITALVPRIIKSSPVDATFMFGNLEAFGLESLLSEVDDFSNKSIAATFSDAQTILDELSEYNYEILTDEQKLTYEMLTFHNQLVLDSEPFLYYYNELEPTSGVQINLPLAFMQIEFEKESEVVAYLKRLSRLPRFFEQIVAFDRAKAEEGLLMPEYLYDLVIKQIDGLLVEPENFMMYLSFCDRIDTIDTIDQAGKNNYKAECLDIVTNSIYPSYASMKAQITNYKSSSTTNTGVCSWPRGREYYEYLIKQETSYDMTVEDLRAWANHEMINCLLPIETLSAKYPEIMTSDNLLEIFPSYSDLSEIYAIENECLSELFYDYGIEPATENIIPSYLEDHLAAGFYFPISIDGEDYGNMYLQESTYNNIDSSTLELYFHENIPGHHMYFSTVYGSDLPMIRKIYSWLPFEEGWAQYIQGLSLNYYGFEEDLIELLKANSDLSYYFMVLMDIQIHYDGISKESAVNSYIELGYPQDAAEDIINRMIANPGEIIHYVYGCYKMEEYLSQCQTELGENFDIKEFHNMILSNASLPFTTIDHVVKSYIKDIKSN